MTQSSTPRASTRLRGLLDRPQPLVVPCAFDSVSARIAEMSGIETVMHGGFNAAASRLGLPDVGTITLSEAIGTAKDMAHSVDIPVIADVDDGFGKPLNAARAIREAIDAGIAGVYMEDQALPKRCPSLGGGQVVEADEMVAKLHAIQMVREKLDPDFVIIARVHASLAISFEEGLRRGEMYAKHGADLVWVDLGYDETVLDELTQIAKHIGPHAKLVANMTENVGRPMLTASELYDMGFALITYPLTLIMAAAKAMQHTMQTLVEQGTTRSIADQMMPVREFREIVNMEKVHAFERDLEARLKDHQKDIHD